MFCLHFCCRTGFLSPNVISARVVETRISGYPFSMRFVLNWENTVLNAVSEELARRSLSASLFWPLVGGNLRNACTEITYLK